MYASWRRREVLHFQALQHSDTSDPKSYTPPITSRQYAAKYPSGGYTYSGFSMELLVLVKGWPI